jgi:hypothetical protein
VRLTDQCDVRVIEHEEPLKIGLYQHTREAPVRVDLRVSRDGRAAGPSVFDPAGQAPAQEPRPGQNDWQPQSR